MYKIARILLLLALVILVCTQVVTSGLQMYADYLCLSAGFSDARLVGFDVFCIRTEGGYEIVAPIIDGKIFVVTENRDRQLPPTIFLPTIEDSQVRW